MLDEHLKLAGPVRYGSGRPVPTTIFYCSDTVYESRFSFSSVSLSLTHKELKKLVFSAPPAPPVLGRGKERKEKICSVNSGSHSAATVEIAAGAGSPESIPNGLNSIAKVNMPMHCNWRQKKYQSLIENIFLFFLENLVNISYSLITMASII
jgi:hypothetical protein